MTVEEALEFFDAVPPIARKLQTLVDVGLGYVRLGQTATTLSGGEAQRVKLAQELSQARHRAARSTSSTSRPPACTSRTSRCCSRCCTRLRDQGNTVVVIEHNLDVIKMADWVIDMGPRAAAAAARSSRPARRRTSRRARPATPAATLAGCCAGGRRGRNSRSGR
jgi:excinuclease ABC subunit A